MKVISFNNAVNKTPETETQSACGAAGREEDGGEDEALSAPASETTPRTPGASGAGTGCGAGQGRAPERNGTGRCHVGHAAGDRTPLRTAEASVAATDRSLSLASQRWEGDGASSLRISPRAARGAPPSADKAGVPLTARTRDRCTGRDCSQHLLWLQRRESVCFRKDPGPTGRKATTGGGATASGLMRGRPLRPVTPHHGCHHFSGGPEGRARPDLPLRHADLLV